MCAAYFIHHGGIKYCVLAAILIGLVFSDLETLLLPDELTLGGLAIGLGCAFFIPVPDSMFQLVANLAGFDGRGRIGSFGEAVLGAVIPAGAIWLGGWIFEKVRHKEGLGFGDVKMLAMIGAFLGISGALFAVILGSLAGSIIGLSYIKLTGKDASTYPLPFGSFLGAAALVAAIRRSCSVPLLLHGNRNPRSASEPRQPKRSLTHSHSAAPAGTVTLN